MTGNNIPQLDITYRNVFFCINILPFTMQRVPGPYQESFGSLGLQSDQSDLHFDQDRFVTHHWTIFFSNIGFLLACIFLKASCKSFFIDLFYHHMFPNKSQINRIGMRYPCTVLLLTLFIPLSTLKLFVTSFNIFSLSRFTNCSNLLSPRSDTFLGRLVLLAFRNLFCSWNVLITCLYLDWDTYNILKFH